jgi:hypothetical protein
MLVTEDGHAGASACRVNESAAAGYATSPVGERQHKQGRRAPMVTERQALAIAHQHRHAPRLTGTPTDLQSIRPTVVMRTYVLTMAAKGPVLSDLSPNDQCPAVRCTPQRVKAPSK